MTMFKILLGATAITLAGLQAKSEPPKNTASVGDFRYMQEFKSTPAPAGYIDFCRRYRGDCSTSVSKSVAVKVTQRKWDELNTINLSVNSSVQPVTDLQLHGQVEVWSYPGRYGDCEDYVLLKRKRLMQQGWPENALLITVLRDENNDGHAVLTVVTDMGDLILDNKVDMIRTWSDPPYTYYLRQSRTNPSKWVNLSANDLGTRPTATTVAGR